MQFSSQFANYARQSGKTCSLGVFLRQMNDEELALLSHRLDAAESDLISDFEFDDLVLLTRKVAKVENLDCDTELEVLHWLTRLTDCVAVARLERLHYLEEAGTPLNLSSLSLYGTKPTDKAFKILGTPKGTSLH